MKIHALLTMLVLATSLLKADELGVAPNFIPHQLSNGWSVDIPASWKVTSEFNQDFSELMQSVSDQAVKRFNIQKNGNLNTQLMAFGTMIHKKATLIITILHNSTPLTQSQVAMMTKEERTNFCKCVYQKSAKSLLDLGADPKAEIVVKFTQYGKIQACAVTLINKKDNEFNCDMHIPNGGQSLVLSFFCDYSDLGMWAPIFDRITDSVKIP